jgi:hypothetical protein
MLIDARKITINFPSRKNNSTEPYLGVLIFFNLFSVASKNKQK